MTRAGTLKSINPATGEDVASYDVTSPEQCDGVIRAAAGTQREWQALPVGARAAILERVAALLEERCDPLAELMAKEMGKPVAAGRAEVEKCAWVCRHYAGEAATYLADRAIEAGRRRSYVHAVPLGVVLAVMPWNFPLWQVFRFAAPALAAGNAGVLKHASNVTGCALAIEDVLRDGGLPDGLFGAVVVPSPAVEALIANPEVRAVTLTGSTAAGAAVAAAAGSHRKKTVLELGGSDPYLILEDADLELAASVCAQSRLINSGQSCIAAKRFIAVDAIHDEFVDRMEKALAAAAVGDPMEPSTQVGPLARRDLRDELARQVRDSVQAGAQLVLGGEVPDGPGAFYPPTLLTGVTPGMPAFYEETFGPVAAVVAAASEQEAIELANRSSFGLGAAVFTTDLDRGERIAADELDAGCCFVNGLVASDPRLPFGGVKDSGYGRELGPLGIWEFVNAKTVVVT